MKRKLMTELMAWKSGARRKPLLLNGARQVGKTHLLKAFGCQGYQDVAYFNLEQSSAVAAIFDGDYEPEKMLSLLSARHGKTILPATTLVILDEIQKNSRAITALKYFYELAPEYHIAAAGSLLGISLGRDMDSFPVGKVNSLTLYPLDFEEFLWAMGKELLSQAIRDAYENVEKFALHATALQWYRRYLAVGGMPESVLESIEKPSLIGFGLALREIDHDYLVDMVKYAEPMDSARIVEAWESVPGQLRKGNHKFQYNKVRSGGRAYQYEIPLTWLQTARVINCCYRADVAENPLGFTVDRSFFRAYLGDTGLLCSKLEADPVLIESGGIESDQFRGILAENYVMQQLISNGLTPYYWQSAGKAELEFVYQDRRHGIIPIEVKSGDNVHSQSIRVYSERYRPEFCLRLSMKNFGYDNGIKSIPLYAAFCIQ